MSEPGRKPLDRRGFLRMGATALAAFAIPAPLRAAVDSPTLTVAFACPGEDRLRSAAWVAGQSELVAAGAARLRVSGRIGDAVSQAWLDVAYRPNREYLFHAWNYRRDSASDEPGVSEFSVPVWREGISVRVHLARDGEDLVEGWVRLGAGGDAGLRTGTYVFAPRGLTGSLKDVRGAAVILEVAPEQADVPPA